MSSKTTETTKTETAKAETPKPATDTAAKPAAASPAETVKVEIVPHSAPVDPETQTAEASRNRTAADVPPVEAPDHEYDK